MEVVRWEWVAGLEWRHNVRGSGRNSQRLWVILDDGQQLSTPLVRGAGWPTDRDITVSQARGDALMAEMQRLRDRLRTP